MKYFEGEFNLISCNNFFKVRKILSAHARMITAGSHKKMELLHANRIWYKRMKNKY